MGNNQFIESNVRERSFIDIWDDPNSFKYNRKFTPEKIEENCQGCYYVERCKGGCNSVSLHMTGKLHNTSFCLRRIEEKKLDVKSSKTYKK